MHSPKVMIRVGALLAIIRIVTLGYYDFFGVKLIPEILIVLLYWVSATLIGYGLVKEAQIKGWV